MPVPSSISTASVYMASHERDMSNTQAGLVNICFEEGQYEAAISTLDQLRSPNIRPAPHHIRQLLYLALYTPSPEVSDEKDNKKKSKWGVAPQSPSATREQKMKFPKPTAQIAAAAVTVLQSILRTNAPVSCAGGLPFFESKRLASSKSKSRISGTPSEADDYADGPLMHHSRCISNARDAWQLLTPGYVPCMDPQENEAREALLNGKQEEKCSVLVAPLALPVLDWLITLYEFDAALHPDHYSPLLLSQIPPSPGVPQWDIEVPIGMIFNLLSDGGANAKQLHGSLSDPLLETQRISLASRLLSLLVACTLPCPPPLIPSNLVRHCSYPFSKLSLSSMQYLLSSLSPIPPHPAPPHLQTDAPQESNDKLQHRIRQFARFKVSLIVLHLAHHSSGNGLTDGLMGGTPAKRKPTAAANGIPQKRRPPPRARDAAQLNGAGITLSATSSSTSLGKQPTQLPYPLPAPSSVLKLLLLSPAPPPSVNGHTNGHNGILNGRPSTPPPHRSPSPSPETEGPLLRHAVVKMALLMGLEEGGLSSALEQDGDEDGPTMGEQDLTWVEAVRTGRVRDMIERLEWPGASAVTMREVANDLVTGWEKRCPVVQKEDAL